MLKIFPYDKYAVELFGAVHAIEPLDPEAEYELEQIDIPNSSGVKISDFSFRSFKELERVNIENYQGDPQDIDLKIFENLEKIVYMSI